MRNFFPTLLLILLLFTPQLAIASVLDDVRMPAQLNVGNSQLLHNGTGVRTRWFLDMYVVGLYLEQQQSQPGPILATDRPMAIRLVITSSLISNDRMERAVRRGFVNATAGHLSHLQGRIAAFIDVFAPGIHPGDIYLMIYRPGQGMEIRRNNRSVALINGLDFKQALFGIWLGERPVDQDLKEGLLGG